MKKIAVFLLILLFGVASLFIACSGDDDDDSDSDATDDAGAPDDDDDNDNDDNDDNNDDNDDTTTNASCYLPDSPILSSCVGEYLDCFKPNGECTKHPLVGGLKGFEIVFLNSYKITYKDDGSGNVRSPTDSFSTCATFEEIEDGKRLWKKIVEDEDGKQQTIEAEQVFEIAADGSYLKQIWTCPDGTVETFTDAEAKDVCMTSGIACSEPEEEEE